MNARYFALFAIGLLGCMAETPTPEDTQDTTDVVDSEQPQDPADPAEVVLDEPCDAGDATWVHRAMLMTWGRRPAGAFETSLWTDVVQKHGRAAALDAMIEDPAYIHWMSQWMMDVMAIDRSGDRHTPTCYNEAMLPDGPELAAFLRDNDPSFSSYPDEFSMRDVVRSGLLLDDVTVAYRANLLTRMKRGPINNNVNDTDTEYSYRESLGEAFLDTYLNRDLECLACHNSEFSVTGHEDETLNRSWELPGHLEKALFGQSVGRPALELFAMFRYHDLVVYPETRVSPWGMAESCASLAPADSLNDTWGDSAFFISEQGTSGSAWDLERYFAQGTDSLRGRVPEVSSTMDVEPVEAFAYLFAANFVERVWDMGTGSRLTLSHRLPRNRHQRDRLVALTESFLTSSWSLRSVLHDVASDPYFNIASPDVCEGEHRLYPLFDPFTSTFEDPETRLNTLGDQLRRVPPRAALRSMHHAMGWEEPPDFYPHTSYVSPPSPFHLLFGAYQFDFAPNNGRGVPFEVMVATQHEYANCRPRADLYTYPGPTCGDSFNGFVQDNACDPCVCDIKIECCRGMWDDECADLCLNTCGGCGATTVTLSQEGDFLDNLVDEAVAQGASVDAVVRALRDRLLGNQDMSDTEQELIATLMGVPLDSLADPTLKDHTGLRQVCGAMLNSPQMLLDAVPDASVTPPTLQLHGEETCQQVRTAMAATGIEWACPTAP